MTTGGDIVGHASSLGILAGVLTNVLPPLVSLITLVWFAIKIYETDTVQKLIGKDKNK